MLIDKFTPEELEQIKAELEIKKTNGSKEYILEGRDEELRDLLRGDIVDTFGVHYKLLELCDCISHNYIFTKNKKDEIVCNRTKCILLRTDPQEYKSIYADFLEVIKKHYKKMTPAEAEQFIASEYIEPTKGSRFYEFGDGVLPSRVYHALIRARITPEELLSMDLDDLKNIRNIGQGGLAAIANYIQYAKRNKEANDARH